MQESILLRHSELKELIHLIRREVQNSQRPATEVILCDEDVMKILKISRRKLQYLIADRKVIFRNLPNSPRRYYYLQDILDLLDGNKTEAITSKF